MVARLLATAAIWVQIQTCLKIAKWETETKEWATHSSPPKKCTKRGKNLRHKAVKTGELRGLILTVCRLKHHLSLLAEVYLRKIFITWHNPSKIGELRGLVMTVCRLKHPLSQLAEVYVPRGWQPGPPLRGRSRPSHRRKRNDAAGRLPGLHPSRNTLVTSNVPVCFVQVGSNPDIKFLQKS